MDRTCKTCNAKLLPRQKKFCSNKCKFLDIEYNKSRCPTIKNDKMLKLQCKICGWETSDINNLSGILTKHEHSDFKLLKAKKRKLFHCPMCNWNTVDLNNKSGCITIHLRKYHQMSPSEFIDKYGEFRNDKNKLWQIYFESLHKSEKYALNANSYVVCQECKNKFRRITITHLKLHGLTMDEYRIKYFSEPTTAVELKNIFSENMINFNKKNIFTKVSNAEQKIVDHIKSLGVVVEQNNRTILDGGKEIDIYLPDYKLAIEYDGLYWHSEFFGKKQKNYHLNKTMQCNKLGIQLIHIFEDEWLHKQEIVKNRLRNILKLNENKLFARKCKIKFITNLEEKPFLKTYHIQGACPSSIKLGAFHENELVAVMTFSKPRISVGQRFEKNNYELTRFATKGNHTVIGIASKLFNFFQKNHEFDRIISFADIRWSSGKLYEILGFKFVTKTSPNYWYIVGNKRVHRFNFMKHKLKILPQYSLQKTEVEIMLEAGYDRIWDCGSLKYEFFKK